MAQRSEDIYQLKRKLEILVQTLVEREVLDRGATLRTLAEYCAIKFPTLKSAWEAGRLSKKNQMKVGASCRFDISDYSWIDRDTDEQLRRAAQEIRFSPDVYPGRDSAGKFRTMIRRSWGISSSENVAIVSNRPINNLIIPASLSIDDAGQETHIDSSIPLFLEVCIEPAFHESGYTYGFDKVFIRLQFVEGNQISALERFTIDGEGIMGNSVISTTGTKWDPSWILENKEGIVAGTFTTSESSLCKLKNARHGHKFEALLNVQLRDSSLQKSNGEEMPTANKSAIIQQLVALPLSSETNETGWFTLTKQCLEIRKVSQL